MIILYILQPLYLYNKHFTSLSSSKLIKSTDIHTDPSHHTRPIPEEVCKHVINYINYSYYNRHIVRKITKYYIAIVLKQWHFIYNFLVFKTIQI